MPIAKASVRASKKLDAVLKVYEFHDHQHAIAILTLDFPDLLAEICDVLLAFRISINFIKKAGGNESEISKALSQQLRPLGWKEEKLDVEITAGGTTLKSDTHKIDYVKDKVTFDLESNIKDSGLERSFYAFQYLIEERGVVVNVMVMRRSPKTRCLYSPSVMFDAKRTYRRRVRLPTLTMWPASPRQSRGRLP